MNNGLPPEDWDQRLLARGGSLLQSRLWAQFQQDLHREMIWEEGRGWQYMAGIRGSRGIRYLLCSYGPAADDSKAMKEAVAHLVKAGRNLKVDFVRVEPEDNISPDQLRKLGGRQIHEFNPEHTQVIDLTRDEAALKSALNPSHRNLINGTQRRGITIRSSHDPADIDLMAKMLEDTAGRSKVRFWPASYYHQLLTSFTAAHVTIFVAEAEGQPVASALFYDWGTTRYYAHAGAFQELNRKVSASVSLVWQALLDAKAAGLTRFDLWGTGPIGDASHHLAGITRFKTSFGGTPVDYVGTWDIPLNRPKYQLYSVYRRLRGMD